MTESNNHSVPSERKTFVPLENNPEVMSHLAHQLGLSPNLTFHDIYSLDDANILSFVPRPAHALLFICHSDVYYRARGAMNAEMPTYPGSGPSEPVLWFKQTIGHACGLIGLLHALGNGAARHHVRPGSDLDTFLAEATPLAPVERAELLYESRALEKAHGEAAQRGDTAAPRAEEPNDQHFVCFVKGGNGHLWELDGGRPGPLDCGALGEGEDVLSEQALRLGVRSFMACAGGDQRFSLVALAPDLEQ